MRPNVDIFCRVVDNFGDIGVCWRLARRLAHDRGWPVRLWVDDLASFQKIERSIDPGCDAQLLNGVTVTRWLASHDACPADFVIEAFACDPPASYVAAMQKLATAPIWVNLEYLSAERWVEDFHALSSLRDDGLRKTFFFPGFTARTGGLLREPDLTTLRNAVQASRRTRARALDEIGLTMLADRVQDPEHRLVILFCYPPAPLVELLATLSASEQPHVTLCVPDSVVPDLERIASTFDIDIVRVPFLPQVDFDRLLWCSDLNIVRGEDSFVRAIWAGRPMLWHIYPQEDGVHLAKLDAWLNSAGLPSDLAHAFHVFNRTLTTSAYASALKAGATTQAKPQGNARLSELKIPLSGNLWQTWEQAARHYSDHLSTMSDLADNLAYFYISARNTR